MNEYSTRCSAALLLTALALASCAAPPAPQGRAGQAHLTYQQPAVASRQFAATGAAAYQGFQQVRYDGWAGPGAGPGWNSGNISRRAAERLTIESAVYLSENGLRLDAARYVRHKCEGEIDCSVKAKTSVLGDPDVGARKTLVVTYRCGNGPQRTISVPEKRKAGIDCD